MRQEFCEVATIEEAQTKCPWAAEVVEADGGFIAFESVDDYNTWAGINVDSEAYNTGFEAKSQKEPRTANPYASGTWDANNWFAGWDAA